MKPLSLNSEDKENARKRPSWNRLTSTAQPVRSKAILSTKSAVSSEKNGHPPNSPLKGKTAFERRTQRISLSQSFIQKRTLTEKQLIAEKLNSNDTLQKKPVLGVYRGKIIQSKVNSFRNTSVEAKKVPLESKMHQTTASKPEIKTRSVSVVVKGVKPKDTLPPKNGQAAKPNSNSAFSKSTEKQGVHTASLSVKGVKPKDTLPPKNGQTAKPNNNSEIKTRSVNVVKGIKPKDTLPPKNGQAAKPNSNSVFSKSTEKQGMHTASLGVMAQKQSERNRLSKSVPPCNSRTSTVSGTKGAEIASKKVLEASTKTGPSISRVNLNEDHKVTVGNKTLRAKESAEERRARIAQWRVSKGRVIKRPPVQAPEVAQPKEEVLKEPPVQPFWITLLEEDEQGLFTEKVNKTIAECIKLIDQGCPQEEVLATLENLVQSVPDAKKLAKYWVCRARLEQQTGSIENVISICEKAVQAGAQPVKELQNTLADLLKNNLLKSESGECAAEEEKNLNDEERAEEVREHEVQEDSEQTSKAKSQSGRRRRKRGGQTMERKVELKGASKRREEEDVVKDFSGDHVSPEKENEESSVIKFSVHTTPYLQSVKKRIQFQDNDSTIGELKFLTPVRRSQRIERNRCHLPKMLQDHDPCVSSIEELSTLGAETDAFIYRRNSALKEMIIVGNER